MPSSHRRFPTRVPATCLLGIMLSGVAIMHGEPQTKNSHGTLTVAGKETPLDYAYAVPQSKKEMLLILSDQPLADKELKDEFERIHRMEADEIHIVEITLDAQKQPMSVSVRHKAFASNWGGGSTEDKFEATTYDNATIAGRAYRSSPGEFNGVSYTFDATFSTNIWKEPPPTYAGEAAKNSEPGKAAIAFLKAGRSGKVAEIKKYIISSAVGVLDGPDGKEMIELLKLGPNPNKAKLTRVDVKGDDAEVVFEEISKDGSATTTIHMVQEDGKWKIDPR